MLEQHTTVVSSPAPPPPIPSSFSLSRYTAKLPDSAVHEVQQWNRGLSAVDRRRKLCAMSENPFKFLRGADHLFFDDFSCPAKASNLEDEGRVSSPPQGPARPEELASDAFLAFKLWTQGDLHLENLGSWKNAKRQVVYSMNDFDESTIADWRYDIYRLGVSIVLQQNRLSQKAEREAGGAYFRTDRNVRDEELQAREVKIQAFLQAFAVGYFQEFPILVEKSKNNQQIHFDRASMETSPEIREYLQELEQSPHGFRRRKLLDKWAPVDASVGDRRFRKKNFAKLSKAPEEIRNMVITSMDTYYASLTPEARLQLPVIEFLGFKDVALRNLQGTGSLGAGRYYLLLDGPTSSLDDDIILELKQQARPSGLFWLGFDALRDYVQGFRDNDAARHNTGYHRLTQDADPYLGYFIDAAPGITYAVRELSPYKTDFPFKKFFGQEQAFLRIYAQIGRIVARSHFLSSNGTIAEFFAEKEMVQQGTAGPGDTQKSTEGPAGVNLLDKMNNYTAITLNTGTRGATVAKTMNIWIEEKFIPVSLNYAAQTGKYFSAFKTFVDTVEGFNCSNTLGEITYADGYIWGASNYFTKSSAKAAAGDGGVVPRTAPENNSTRAGACTSGAVFSDGLSRTSSNSRESSGSSSTFGSSTTHEHVESGTQEEHHQGTRGNSRQEKNANKNAAPAAPPRVTVPQKYDHDANFTNAGIPLTNPGGSERASPAASTSGTGTAGQMSTLVELKALQREISETQYTMGGGFFLLFLLFFSLLLRPRVMLGLGSREPYGETSRNFAQPSGRDNEDDDNVVFHTDQYTRL
ncbi:unnamed protein product [Amoebophrya sp. A120]|nr:unnamed protein product [Amoebophrya sp. A120]|eukprot:GSA120T00018129001.1